MILRAFTFPICAYKLPTDLPFSRNVDYVIRGTNHNNIGQVSWDFANANKSCFLFRRLLLYFKFSISVIWHTLYFKHKVTIRSKIIITCRNLKQDKWQLLFLKSQYKEIYTFPLKYSSNTRIPFILSVYRRKKRTIFGIV